MKITACAAAACLTAGAHAATVIVTATGEVEFNGVSSGQLGNANPGDPATMTFEIDSNFFVDSASFPTRGYRIIPSTFQLTLGTETLSLQSPFPAGQQALFVLRNDDPAVDGFYVSTDVDGPNGVPISQAGGFGQFVNSYSVTYTGDTLTSLDVLNALGTYDFTGLTVFNWTINDGPFKPVGMVIEQLVIELEPTCDGDLDGDGNVGFTDLNTLLAAWGACPACPEDLDGDGNVGFTDLNLLLGGWGPCL